MEKLLKAKHWQIFLLLVIGTIIGNLKVYNDPMITTFLTILGIIIYAIYPIAIGHFLQEHLPKKVELNHNFFLINVFVWISAYSAILILSDGHGMTFKGLIALPFIYILFALLYSFYFPAKTLKSIEQKNEASFGDCFGDFFLFLFLPLGIWVLQPRINKIIENRELISAKENSL